MTEEQAYFQGFMDKCAEYGIPEKQAFTLTELLAVGTPVAAAVGAGTADEGEKLTGALQGASIPAGALLGGAGASRLLRNRGVRRALLKLLGKGPTTKLTDIGGLAGTAAGGVAAPLATGALLNDD
jgi:hypothetical protein